AVLLLLLAWLVATIAKRLVVKVLKKIKAEKFTEKLGIADETTGSSLDFIGKLVFFIVFLLFLPGVLDRLGMQNVSAPISVMTSMFLNYIPNILAAVIILVVGIFVANTIRQLLIPILKKFKVDKIQEKAGIASTEGTALSSVISYVVYVLILIPVIIAALQILNISAISVPAIAMLNTVMIYLPNIFIAIAIIIVGIFIARIAGKLLTEILSSVGTDKLTQNFVATEGSKLQGFSLSKAIGETVKYIIILLFVVEALNVLKLEVLRYIGESIISYLPFAISALIILIGALLLATWVENLILKHYPNAKISALAAKCVIIILAVFISLTQLGIAPLIINAAFILILGALAIAFAISFGIGGREFAANTLKKLESKIKTESQKGNEE
ncbi:MAG: mechanosensitive ion channel, partial [Desulfosporosinus sp.]